MHANGNVQFVASIWDELFLVLFLILDSHNERDHASVKKKKKNKSFDRGNVVSVKCVHECLNYVQYTKRNETKQTKEAWKDELLTDWWESHSRTQLIYKTMAGDVGLMNMLVCTISLAQPHENQCRR